MKYIEIRNTGKRLSTLAVLGAIVAPSLVSTAQAKPKDGAPAWGYRKDKDRNKHNDTASTVVTGVITRDFRGQRRFQLRASNGRVYEVNFARNVSSSVTVGDNVRVTGDVRGNDIFASRIQILRQGSSGSSHTGNNGYNGNTSFTGVVTSLQSLRHFTVRADNGRTYTISSATNVSSDVSVGDRVNIHGDAASNGDIRLIRIGIVANSGNATHNANGNTTGSQAINFNGVIVTARNGASAITVRSDAGRNYIVRVNPKNDYTVGRHVRVSGRWNGSQVVSANIRVL